MSMKGKRVTGYVCVNRSEGTTHLHEKLVYTSPVDSLTGLTKSNPVVYKVKGTSKNHAMQYTESQDRAYYECYANNFKILGEISKDELVNDMYKSCDKSQAVLRLIAYYPISLEDAIEFAKHFIDQPLTVNIICKRFTVNGVMPDELAVIQAESIEREARRRTAQRTLEESYKTRGCRMPIVMGQSN